MIILENITKFLETFLIRTISLVLNTSLNFLKEIFKFVLILVLIYYFAFWTFRLWHPDLVEYDPKTLNARIDMPDGSLDKKTSKWHTDLEEYDPKTLNARIDKPDGSLDKKTSKWHPDLEEYDPKTLNARIDKPDASLVKKALSLIEQLEIEAEFEVNKKKIVRLKPSVIAAKDSDEGAIPKIEFISLVEYKQNTTSRPTQTKKTSLGKKSKLRDKSNQTETNKMNKTAKTVKKGKAVKIDDELPTHDDLRDHDQAALKTFEV